MRAFPALAALALAVLPALALPAQAQLPPLPVPGGGPGSAAVNAQVEIQDPGGLLIPTRPYSLTVTVHYQYAPGGVAGPGPEAEVCGVVSVPSPPPWAAVAVKPPELCFGVPPGAQTVGGTTVTNTTIVEVNVTEAAPALAAYNLTVAFDAPAQGSLQAAHGENSRVVAPGFVGRLRLDLPGVVVVRGGAPQPVPVTVHNLGNGPVTVRLANATAPQGLRVVLPEPFVIAEPGGQATVDLLLEAPWTTPVRGQVAFATESHHALRGDLQGDTPRARLDVDGKAAIPGFEPVLALAAGLGLAGIRRRRRT